MNRVFFLLALLISTTSLAQFSPVKRAMDNLEEGDVLRAKDLLIKALEKDSLDPAIKYGLSILYNTSAYTGANIDSSYYFILSARKNYDLLDDKEIDKMIKSGIDPVMLETQKEQLDRQAFILSEEVNTVEAYQEYQSKFSTSRFFDNARNLERKVAFENTQMEDTHEVYQAYMDRYPNSQYFNQALKRFELLFFKDLTSSKRLDDYLNFLEKRPNSPYRQNAESEILEIIVAGNRLVDFKKFLEISKVPTVMKKARDILYHILKDDQALDLMPSSLWTDSLRSLSTTHEKLFPFIDKGGYYFINEDGVKADYQYPEISKVYLCNPPQDDILIVKNTSDLIIISRDSKSEIFKGTADKATDLGYGIIKLEKDSKSGILLKNGTQISPYIYDDIKLIGNSFIAVKSSGAWGLVSFLGRIVLPINYESIDFVNGSILLKKDSKIAISSINTIRKGADGEKINLVFIYDEWEEWSGEKLWVRSGSSEALINLGSSFDIELKDQEIIQEGDYYLIYGTENALLDLEFLTLAKSWQDVKISDRFFSFKYENKSVLLNKATLRPSAYDTVKLWGNQFATSIKQAEHSIHFMDGERKAVSNHSDFKWIHDDSTEYLLMIGEEVNTLFNADGHQIMEVDESSFKVLGPEYLVLQKEGKEFLYSSKGELLLERSFDAFVSYTKGGISVLQNGKLGYFHLRDSVWIEPAYSKRITDTQNGYYLVSDGSAMQIIQPGKENVTVESFEDIVHWTDSAFLVKKDKQYFVSTPGESAQLSEKFSEVKKDYLGTPNILVRDISGNYGLLNQELKTIVGTGFSYIERFGDVWKAEKYLKESNFYVVALYSHDGTLIFRTGMTPEEYDRLICEPIDEY